MSPQDAPGATTPPDLDVRAIRSRLGLTGPQFAALLNARIPGSRFSKQSVWRWESGRLPPSPAVAFVLRAIDQDSQR